MKRSRLIGLVVVAALAVVILADLGTASAATVLCKKKETGCEAVNTLPAGTDVDGKLGGPVGVSIPGTEISCKGSILESETTAASGSPLPGGMTNLTFSECKSSLGTNCTMTAMNLPYFVSFEETGGSGNGLMTVKAAISGNPAIKVVCGALINCTLSKAEMTANFTGGAPAEIFLKGPVMERAGLICPTSANFSGVYDLTAPVAAWLEQ